MIPEDHKPTKRQGKIKPREEGIADLYIQSDTDESRPPLTWYRFGVWLVVITLVGLAVVVFNNNSNDLAIDREDTVAEGGEQIPRALTEVFDTDFSQVSVDPTLLLSGGPGKNGIPALVDPEFESIDQTSIAETTRGILIERNGETKFYPYNILVWHEIVNDKVGGDDLAITFCPLCGSAIVYNRTIDGVVHEFRVSGLLYESNMVMYDTKTESLFSQSLGEGIAGTYNGKQLQVEKFQLMELFEVKQQYPETQIMTTNTGHSRNYAFYPYGNYDFNEDLYYPVQYKDDRYSGKELFYIVPLAEQSVAIRIGELGEDGQITDKQTGLKITKKGSSVDVTTADGADAPGYFEMWFSWATHHQEDGRVVDPSKS
ncbi:MAG: DUF3179 domain-containing protein [Candidatus Saccharimonadales bacterium]|nr:DUF3179 domain-containing protein [Candidatus Saccharimonadales bacterium]